MQRSVTFDNGINRSLGLLEQTRVDPGAAFLRCRDTRLNRE